MQNTTLVEVMTAYAQAESTRSALYCWDGSQRDYIPVSYRALSQRAFGFGAQLIDKPDIDHAKTNVVMIACHSPYATLVAFYGAISVGAIPMIFPMPLSLGSHEALTARIKHWGFAFDQPAQLVLESGLVEKFHNTIPAEINIIRLSADPQGACASLDTCAISHQPTSSDVAFFQTTSSSTGDHKAVAISHGNIIANVQGIRHAQNMDNNERMASWLPLFHDMGLVGTVLFSFCNDYPLLIMTPTQFVKRPALWLKGMHEYRCTIATAPNFGFDYCSRLISDKDASEMDLSCVKHLFIGAEPIRVSTVNAFLQKFSISGITSNVMRPAYGLAESTIITSMANPDKVSQFICLDADAIGINEPINKLDTIAFDDPNLEKYVSGQAIAVCTAGSAIEGLTIDIVDDEGNKVDGEGIAGEIAISGSSVALGYVSTGQGSRGQGPVERFPLGRLRTGDLGVMVDGELYILERLKNVIIRNGENFLVSALEERLAELLKISHEHIAVFESDILNPSSDIIVLVERHAPIDEREVDNLLVAMPKEAFPINKILLCKSREIPRTTSGKKRHFYCRKMYQQTALKYQQAIDVSPQRIMQAMQKAAE